MNKQEEINALLDCDFTKYQLVVNRIYKDEYVKKLEHNWNELKKWLEERCKDNMELITFRLAICRVLDKIKELEEGENNE